MAQERALVKTIERADAIADSTETEVRAETQAPQETPDDIGTAALAQPEITPPENTSEETFVLTAPELDLVRFDADGAGLIAGRAQVGVLVSVLLDGKVLDQFEVQNGGEFVSFSSINPSAEARVVSLQAAFNGQLVMSDATFILAPSAAAAVVATASEPPSEQDVAQADVTPEVQGGSVAPEELTEAAAPAVAAPDVTAKASAAVVVAEASSLSEDPTAEPPAAVTDQPVEVAQAADKPVSAVATAAVIPQPVSPPVSQPVTETETETVAEAVAETVAETVAEPVAEIVAETVVETVPQPQPKSAPVLMAILKADADGVELVQPAGPIAPELVGKVSLDLISYSDEGDVQLAGRAAPLSRVRVYLDNSPVGDFQATEDGRWKGQLRDVEPGIYTLRLDELDGAGKVLSRLETPFKRESPEALKPAAVAGVSPAQAPPPIRAVTVQKGDTLWAISRERYGDGLLYVRLFEANQDAIRDPDLIYPGQIFSIPE